MSPQAGSRRYRVTYHPFCLTRFIGLVKTCEERRLGAPSDGRRAICFLNNAFIKTESKESARLCSVRRRSLGVRHRGSVSLWTAVAANGAAPRAAPKKGPAFEKRHAAFQNETVFLALREPPLPHPCHSTLGLLLGEADLRRLSRQTKRPGRTDNVPA